MGSMLVWETKRGLKQPGPPFKRDICALAFLWEKKTRSQQLRHVPTQLAMPKPLGTYNKGGSQNAKTQGLEEDYRVQASKCIGNVLGTRPMKQSQIPVQRRQHRMAANRWSHQSSSPITYRF